MRLIESVARKLRHQVEDLLHLLFGKILLRGALQKTDPLLFHFLGFFLPHRATQDVGFPKGIARQNVRDLHYLFLVNDYAQSLGENRLQLRQFVNNLLPAVFAVNEVVDHAALDGARPVQRIQCNQVLNTRRFVAPQHIAHSSGFKLKHTAGKRSRKDLIGLFVVQWNGLRLNLYPPGLGNQP